MKKILFSLIAAFALAVIAPTTADAQKVYKPITGATNVVGMQRGVTSIGDYLFRWTIGDGGTVFWELCDSESGEVYWKGTYRGGQFQITWGEVEPQQFFDYKQLIEQYLASVGLGTSQRTFDNVFDKVYYDRFGSQSAASPVW